MTNTRKLRPTPETDKKVADCDQSVIDNGDFWPQEEFIFFAKELERQRDELSEALRRSMTAIDDWLNVYTEDNYDAQRVAEAKRRIWEFGTIAYIADVQQQNRAALARIDAERI